MGDYTVIADVGQSLVKLLRENLTPEPIPQPEYIGLGSPADKTDLRLSLFLYNIRESGEVRRNEMLGRGTERLQYPPLAIELYYLMTAYSQAEQLSRALDESRIIGRAMQVLYDNSILRGSQLVGTLAEHNQEIRIVLDNIPVDILMRLWNFPNIPYKLSVGYVVGPVLIDSRRIRTTKRVREAHINVGG